MSAPASLGRGSTLRTVLVAAAGVVAILAGVVTLASGADTPTPPEPGSSLPSAAAPPPAGGLGGSTLGDHKEAVGIALPDATLEGFDGGPPVPLSQYRGTPLVVNFWATWCAPCVAEMPDLQAVAEQTRGQVAFLGINYQDAPSNARTFVEDLGITYDLATDADGNYLEGQVRGFGMPTTLLVDRDGIIVDRHTGPLDVEELRARLREHLGVDVGEVTGR